MERPRGHTRVTPYQLCALCWQLVARYSKDIFWDVNSYKWDELDSWLQPDPQILGVLEQPLAYHDNLASLQKSAAEGCHLCTICSHSRRSYLDETHGQGQLYVRVSKWNGSSCPTLRLTIYEKCSPPEQRTPDTSQAFVCRNPCTEHPGECTFHRETCPIDSPEARYKWCTTTDCDEGYEIINHWLQQCLNLHHSCHKSLDNIRPTRLLDLNAILSDQDIRLAAAEDIGKQPYATLSYRWGESPNARLKTYNYEEFRTRIVLKSLPRTIRDAVKVCRRLLVRYLWVDSLCIIQEDSEDLAHEIAQMGSIYAGSIITIAATDSIDCESGFFRERQPLWKASCIVNDDHHGFAFFPELCCSVNSHHSSLNESNLSERGWVYQERVLSPRTVHFTADEIIWECRERIHCPDCSKQQQNVTRAHFMGAYPAKMLFSELQDLSLSSTSDGSFQITWSDIVLGYTGTQLSSVDDRLSALAGIAQLVHDKIQFQTSYGIWLEGFLEGLLWFKGHTDDLNHAPNFAPSWSWASNQSQIRQDYHNINKERALYTAIVTKFPRATPFAQITQLSRNLPGPTPIRIHGWLRACHVMPYQGRWYLVPTTGNSGDEVETYITAAWEAFEKRNEIVTVAYSLDMQRKELSKAQVINDNQYFQPDEEPRRRKKMFCVLLKRKLEALLPKLFTHIGVGITDLGVVCEAVDLSKNLFRRAGYFLDQIALRTDGKHNKYSILEDLGFHRQRDGTLRGTSSLSVDVPTAIRLLGLTLANIEDQDGSPNEGAPEDLSWQEENLLLFKDGFEEAEIEII